MGKPSRMVFNSSRDPAPGMQWTGSSLDVRKVATIMRKAVHGWNMPFPHPDSSAIVAYFSAAGVYLCFLLENETKYRGCALQHCPKWGHNPDRNVQGAAEGIGLFWQSLLTHRHSCMLSVSTYVLLPGCFQAHTGMQLVLFLPLALSCLSIKGVLKAFAFVLLQINTLGNELHHPPAK